MPPRPSDRALRRLVADLAGRPKADVRAVLADLGPDERARVERLMAEFQGRAPAQGAPTETGATANTDGLSPWFAARLRTAVDGAPASDFAMTRRALEALKLAAASAEIDRQPAMKRARSAPGSGIYDLVANWLGRPVR